MRSVLLLPEQSEGKTKMMKQQYLPFTVLKLYFLLTSFSIARLQQYLPFTVLKHTTAPYACSISYRLKHQQIVKALYLEGSFCMQNI